MNIIKTFACGISVAAVLTVGMAAATETCVENNTTFPMGASFLAKGEKQKEAVNLAPGESVCEQDYEGEMEIFVGDQGTPAISALKLHKGGRVKVVQRGGGYFLEQLDAEGNFISSMKIRRVR